MTTATVLLGPMPRVASVSQSNRTTLAVLIIKNMTNKNSTTIVCLLCSVKHFKSAIVYWEIVYTTADWVMPYQQ